MIVAKFGGTSVADASSMSRVGNILLNKVDKPVLVVLSASAGITDKLHQLVILSADRNTNDAHNIISAIELHHNGIINELFKEVEFRNEALQEINKLISDIRKLSEGITLLGEFTLQTIDSMLHYGELLSSKIFYFYLSSIGEKVQYFDIREVIKTDENFTNANVLEERSRYYVLNILKPIIDKNNFVITQGFIASSESGKTTTLGRGGSDYTASLLGEYLKADEIQIWSDADGIMTADPKITNKARTIKYITYNAVKELSYFGAKILHPASIKPAIKNHIPVKVLNTFDINNPGTLILDKILEELNLSYCFVLKENCLLYNFDFNGDSNFFFLVLSNLVKNNIKPIFIVGNINQIQIVFDQPLTNENEDIIIKKSLANISKQEVDIILISNNDFNRSFGLDIRSILKSLSIYESLLCFNQYSYVVLSTPPGQGSLIIKLLHDNIIL